MFKPDFSNININKNIPTISISTILSMITTPFDRDRVVELTYKKHYNNPESQYYHKTKEEIINMWEAKGEDSRKYGSLLDDYIGANLTGTENDVKLFKLQHNYDSDERLHGLCDSFDNFYSVMMKSGDMEFVDRERTVYYKVEIPNPDNENEILEYYIKGRFDALFYNKRTNKWIIIDWKSSGTIEKFPNQWTKKLLGPMNRFPELNWYTYTSQLYYYKKSLIEEKYLPEGTKESDVIVLIVNLPGTIIEELGQNFGIHKAAYDFDSLLFDQLFEYAVKKDYEQKKEEELKRAEQDNAQKIEQQENISNLF